VKKSAFILLLLGSQCSASASEIPKNNPEYLSYEIKQGENLSIIASKYLEGDQALNILLRLNNKNKPNSIPVGEKIFLPKDLLKYSPSIATVSKLNCSNAFLVNNNPQQIEIGSVLNQDDIIKVPAGCQVGVTLEDGSNINLVSGSVLKFKTLRTSAMEKSPQVDFELMNGRVDVEVVKRAKGDAPFEIHTPKALAGVRGTQFRVGFDEQKNTSQVEVKNGIVAAKGQANDSGESLTENQGIPISEDGLAGAVETLPLSPNFLAIEKQLPASLIKVKFQADQNADRHILRQSQDATFSQILEDHLVDIAQIELNQLSNNAVFYQWISLTKSGLQGSPGEYAICKSDSADQADRCNVGFNMRGFKSMSMYVQKFDEITKAYQDVVKTGQTISEREVFLLKNLPAGKYQWQMSYKAGDDAKVERKGIFDLIVVN
jgi:hypothetical protein